MDNRPIGSVEEAVGRTTAYNSEIGNSYTASLSLGPAALLESPGDLSGRAVGFLSYGSGSVAELFIGTVTSGYREYLRTDEPWLRGRAAYTYWL